MRNPEGYVVGLAGAAGDVGWPLADAMAVVLRGGSLLEIGDYVLWILGGQASSRC
jgi:hypothetical protein